MYNTAKQTHSHLIKINKIVIVPHQNPDGDSLGSASAMAEYAHILGKNVTLFCITPVYSALRFLPHVDKIKHDPKIFEGAEAIIVLDSGDLKYAGIDELISNHPATVINIDHHQTNEGFGKFNILNPNASSTAEILYYYFRHNHIPLNPNMATALLTGVITDTDSFSNPATSTAAMSVASDLLYHGGNLKLINKKLFRNKTVNILKLWGLVFSRINKNESLDIAYTYITQKDFKQNNVSEAETEGIANFLNNLGGAKMSLILKETAEGKIKGSFRTTRDEMDVASLAKKLGGGGHKKAAGFTADGTIDDVLQKIFSIQI